MSKGTRALMLMVMLAASGLALATVGTVAARAGWVFDLFSHFRLQYVVAAVVLGIAALALRAYPSAVVLAVVALVHGWAIKDLWLGAGATAAPGGVPLRIVSANVWANNPAPAKVAAFVRASDADLAVLVDASRRRWQPALDELASSYRYHTERIWLPDDDRDRHLQRAPVILFSRYPILAERVVWPTEGRRPYLIATLEVDGRPLTVVAVHSSSPLPTRPGRSRERNHELDHIAAEVSGIPGPVIVAGDFNTTPWSPYFQDLIAAAGLRDAGAGDGYVATWPTWFWPALIPIDHVLLKGPLAVTTIRRGPAVGSDHYPLCADLRLGPEL